MDEIYAAALSSGALGGKLSGAGGGGFLLLYVPIEKQTDVKKKLSRLLYVPFRFESNGTRIIYYDQQLEYKEEEQARTEKDHSPFVGLKDVK